MKPFLVQLTIIEDEYKSTTLWVPLEKLSIETTPCEEDADYMDVTFKPRLGSSYRTYNLKKIKKGRPEEATKLLLPRIEKGHVYLRRSTDGDYWEVSNL